MFRSVGNFFQLVDGGIGARVEGVVGDELAEGALAVCHDAGDGLEVGGDAGDLLVELGIVDELAHGAAFGVEGVNEGFDLADEGV